MSEPPHRPTDDRLPQDEAPAGDAPCVLVVDDDAVTRSLVAEMLKARGCSVVEAEDGEGATERLGARDFDAVFLDIMMPKSDGFSVLRWMRANHRTRIPVVVFTGADDQTGKTVFQQMSDEMGALRSYAKPITARKIADALAAIGLSSDR
jgi:CheY-like chemotaxis protein